MTPIVVGENFMQIKKHGQNSQPCLQKSTKTSLIRTRRDKVPITLPTPRLGMILPRKHKARFLKKNSLPLQIWLRQPHQTEQLWHP